MEISQEHRGNMEYIIKTMQAEGIECSKDFECYKSGLEKLCEVKHIDVYDNIECKSPDAMCCGHSFLALGTHRYCKCPLRRYIAQHFHR